MTDTTYNGWPNRETWALCLWADNDQGTYNYVCDLVGQYGDNNDDTHLGGLVVTALEDQLLESRALVVDTLRANTGHLLPAATRQAIADAAHDAAVCTDDIGSFYRIDRETVGAWARELVTA